jgi:hypothetical protein
MDLGHSARKVNVCLADYMNSESCDRSNRYAPAADLEDTTSGLLHLCRRSNIHLMLEPRRDVGRVATRETGPAGVNPCSTEAQAAVGDTSYSVSSSLLIF